VIEKFVRMIVTRMEMNKKNHVKPVSTTENESVTNLIGMLMLRSNRGEGRSLGGTIDNVMKSLEAV
jgi:hypothetical protein